MKFRSAFIGVGLAVLTVSGLAQTPGSTGPAFEVASVKQNKLGPAAPQRMSNLPAGDRVTFTNVTARNLIQVTYTGFSDITGGPDWMGAPGPPNASQERFDVNAKAESASTHEQLVAMMKTLLAERFKLVTHTEDRQRDVYALRLAKADGSLGPQIRPAKADCATLRAAATDPASQQSVCGTIGTNAPPWHLRGASLNQFAVFQFELGRPVVNKTGLTGPFDFDLIWTPLWFQDANADRSRFPNIDANRPNIFTAVQEQLGLKFVSEKDTQLVLVIDHIEHPTED